MGMDLGGGGAKPPQFVPQTNSPRGINIYEVPDDINYTRLNAFQIKKNGDSDTEIYTTLGNIIETEKGYLIFFSSEKSDNFELNPLD